LTQSKTDTDQNNYLSKILQKEHDLGEIQIDALKNFWTELKETEEIAPARKRRYTQCFFHLMNHCFNADIDPRNPTQQDLTYIQGQLNQLDRSPDTKADMVLSWNRFMDTLEGTQQIDYEMSHKTELILEKEEEV
jgi:hypothetical protein